MQTGAIYIDESGHTGDLLKPDRGYGFSGQPHFVLAGVGPMSPEQASALLEPLVARHRLKMQEIKSDRLHKRPAFARDLIRALREAQVPMFIEAYVAACRADSAEAARASLVRLLGWAREADAEDEGEAAILAALGRSLADTLDDFEQACAEAPDGYRRFLPVPDTGKRDKTYWLLPNYSSLTNLYARINRFQRGKLAHLTLVHDEQAQFDGILWAAKQAVEALVDESGHIHLGADYAFGETAELVFARSSASPGLMIADVIAGHVRRVLREHMAGREIDANAYAAFMEIWETGDEARGIGLNLVLPTETARQFQFDALLRHAASWGTKATAGT